MKKPYVKPKLTIISPDSAKHKIIMALLVTEDEKKQPNSNAGNQ